MNARDLSQAELEAIDKAVRSVGKRMNPEDRFDLRQDLAIKLMTKPAPPADLDASVRAWARNAAANLVRDEKTERETAQLAAKAAPRYRKGANWSPTWYPPDEDAQEFAPFACEGARMMHVKGGYTGKDMDSALAEWVDSK